MVSLRKGRVMTRDQRVYYYQSLALLFGMIPFLVVAYYHFDLKDYIDMPVPKKCAVYHENAPTYDLRCQEEYD